MTNKGCFQTPQATLQLEVNVRKHQIFAFKCIYKCSWKVSFLFLYFYNFTRPHYITKSFHVSNSNKEHTVVLFFGFLFYNSISFMKNSSKPQAHLNLTIKELLLLIKNVSYQILFSIKIVLVLMILLSSFNYDSSFTTM